MGGAEGSVLERGAVSWSGGQCLGARGSVLERGAVSWSEGQCLGAGGSVLGHTLCAASLDPSAMSIAFTLPLSLLPSLPCLFLSSDVEANR